MRRSMMKKPVAERKNPKDLLRQAEKAARNGEMEEGLRLFEVCIRKYIHNRQPFKALAAAKLARNSFASHPKAHALLMRLLDSMGHRGDLEEQYEKSSELFMKGEVPIFRDLGRQEFIELLDIMQITTVTRGRLILRQQDPGEDVYILIEGSAVVCRDGQPVAEHHPGDVFGELGFFYQAARSASVRTRGTCRLARIPAGELRELCVRFPGIRHSLEALYHERILKKAGEDLKSHPLADLENDHLTIVRFSRGQDIPLDPSSGVTIIKHGIVEVDMDEKGVRVKRFLRPGHVLERIGGSARANTDVEVIRAQIDPLGREKA